MRRAAAIHPAYSNASMPILICACCSGNNLSYHTLPGENAILPALPLQLVAALLLVVAVASLLPLPFLFCNDAVCCRDLYRRIAARNVPSTSICEMRLLFDVADLPPLLLL